MMITVIYNYPFLNQLYKLNIKNRLLKAKRLFKYMQNHLNKKKMN